MSFVDVVIVRTGAGNLASVEAAFCRLGLSVGFTQSPEAVEKAPRLVLPGVGSFGAVMEGLRSRGLDSALARRVLQLRPTLSICLGLQLLAEDSEESPGVKGLGVLAGGATRFPLGTDDLRVPHLGWNTVESEEPCRLLESGAGYFANSYRLEKIPAGWRGAWSQHGGPFVAAMEQGPVLLCQFHPELSGSWGERLLERWFLSEEVPSC